MLYKVVLTYAQAIVNSLLHWFDAVKIACRWWNGSASGNCGSFGYESARCGGIVNNTTPVRALDAPTLYISHRTPHALYVFGGGVNMTSVVRLAHLTCGLIAILPNVATTCCLLACAFPATHAPYCPHAHTLQGRRRHAIPQQNT